MTAMAPNLIAIGLANSFGIKISWMEWFIAALLPGNYMLTNGTIYNLQVISTRDKRDTKCKKMG